MASSSAGAVRTPLESVFSYIPPSHEKGVKQALFNVAALGGVITVGATGLATYAVFQPFVKPLLWALLLGTVTHPVKRRLTAATRRWLADLERSGSPLFLHALLAPLWAFDAATDAIGDAAVRHIGALVAFVVGSATAEELEQLCLDNLARFKRPKDWRFVESLPKNNYGKIVKTDLRARLAGEG